MSRTDRQIFLGPWRSHSSRRATLQVLAGMLRIDRVMADVELADGHHFPFSDDPQAYAAAICTW